MDALRHLRPLPLAGLAFLLGLLAATGFAPLFMWLMTLAGVGVLLLLLVLQPQHGFALGWGFGFGLFLASLFWIATAFSYQAAMPAFVGWLAVAGLSAYLALYVGLAGFATTRLARGPLSTILLFAGCFTLAELARGLFFTGFAWNPLGEVLLAAGPLAGLAAFVGAPGLAVVVVLLAGAFPMLAEKGRLRFFYFAALGVGLVAASALVLARPLPKPTGDMVLLVQPNVSMAEKLAPGGSEFALQKLAWLTGMALAEHPGAKAVIWPEAAVPTALAEDGRLRQGLASLLQDGQLLLTGSLGYVRDAKGDVVGVANRLDVLGADGTILAHYDKAHLVPGGEYLPLRPFAEKLGLARLVPGEADFIPGPGPRTLRLAGLPAVGPDICYEVTFPGEVASRAVRPRWLLTISNDGWFGRFGPPQHFAQARLRAIEEGLPLLRVTMNGISGVVNAHGAVEEALSSGQLGVLVAVIPGAAAPTLFARFGLLVPFLLGIFMLGAGFVARRHPEKPKKI